MLHRTFDDAMMNAAYLSELWGTMDMMRFRDAHPEHWSIAREKQLEDELRHTSMCLAALKTCSDVIVHDLAGSIQESLYGPYIKLKGIDVGNDYDAILDILEHRAIWIYRTYVRVGTNETYKKVFRQIIDDEKRHIHINVHFKSSMTYKTFKGLDRLLFHSLMLENDWNMMQSKWFWSYYYRDCTVSA